MSKEVRKLYAQKKTTYEDLVRGLKSPLRMTTGNSSAKAHGFFFALGEYGGHLDVLYVIGLSASPGFRAFQAPIVRAALTAETFNQNNGNARSKLLSATTGASAVRTHARIVERAAM